MASDRQTHSNETRGGMTRRAFATSAAAALVGAVASVAVGEEAAPEEGEEPQEETAADGEGATPATEPEPEPEPAPTQQSDESSTIDPYSLEEGAGINYLASFEDRIETTTWNPRATYLLPVGCNVSADCETCASVIQANDGGNPFTVIGLLNYQTGVYSVVLANPFGGTGYAPSEAHITDSLMAWVEVNNATNDWALYAGTFDGNPIMPGAAGIMKLGEGDANWLPPQVAVSGPTVIWQAMPDPAGPYSREDSKCYRWTLGASVASELWSSPGRFACMPSINEGQLTIVPRLNAKSGVYYGITALNLIDGSQIDQIVMPASVRPFRATRFSNIFAFSIEANYGYGGLLGRMGYYFGSGSGPFDYIAREPSAQVCSVNGRYIVRSQLSYFVVDPITRSYSRIGAAKGCVDYGDYPVTSGTTRSFVSYTKLKDESTGVPNNVCVRIFDFL